MALTTENTPKRKKSTNRVTVYILFFVLFFCGFFLAREIYDDNGREYGVGPEPDRILLSWVTDPSSSMAVTWRSNTEAGEGKVQISQFSKGPDLEQGAREVIAEREIFTTIHGSAHYYSANMNGLQPETTYAYRVGNEQQWSEWNYFTTASNESKPFSFLFMGDVQNDIRSEWSRVVRKAYSDASDAAFILYSGDIVSKRKDSEWGQWFYATGFIHKMIPCLVTPGNHEYSNGTVCIHWNNIFRFPKNGPIECENLTYYVDYQGARIISLDSNTEIEPQTEWLRNVLEKNNNTWTIVAFHHPVHFVSKSRDPEQPRNTWLPLFDEYDIDLILQGHDHAYVRTGLIRLKDGNMHDFESNRDEGTIYVVSISGTKMYTPVINETIMERVAANTQLYQIIHIDGNTLQYKAKSADGEIYDAFTLIKQADGKKLLTNEIPDTPERK